MLVAAETIRVPVLGFFGSNDSLVPNDQVQQLDENLDRAGIEHLIITYPDAQHNFFDRKANEFAQESADSWKRILGFINEQSRIIPS